MDTKNAKAEVTKMDFRRKQAEIEIIQHIEVETDVLTSLRSFYKGNPERIQNIKDMELCVRLIDLPYVKSEENNRRIDHRLLSDLVKKEIIKVTKECEDNLDDMLEEYKRSQSDQVASTDGIEELEFELSEDIAPFTEED